MIYRLYDMQSKPIGSLTTDQTDIETAIDSLLSLGPWITVDTIPGTQRKINLNHVTYIDAIPESIANEHRTETV
jgi:hypothetical protein